MFIYDVVTSEKKLIINTTTSNMLRIFVRRFYILDIVVCSYEYYHSLSAFLPDICFCKILPID